MPIWLFQKKITFDIFYRFSETVLITRFSHSCPSPPMQPNFVDSTPFNVLPPFTGQPPIPPIYKSMFPTPSESTPPFPPSWGCPFLCHNMHRSIKLPLENYPPSHLIGQTPLKINFFGPAIMGQPFLLEMSIFCPLPNFYSFPDFGLEISVC